MINRLTYLITLVVTSLLFVQTTSAQIDGEEDLYDYSFASFYSEGTLGEIVPFQRYEVKEERYKYFKGRAQIARKTGNQKVLAVATRNMGWINYRKDNVKLAIKQLEASLAAQKEAGDDIKVATAYAHLGYVQIHSGQVEKGIANYNSAEQVLQNQRKTNAVALLAAATGQAYMRNKDYDRALTNYQRALKKYQQIKEYKAVLNIKNKIGEIRLFKGNVERAIEDFKFCLEFLEKNEEPQAKSIVLRNLGIASFKQNKYEEAAKYFEESLRVRDDRRVKTLLRDTYLKLSVQSNVSSDFKRGEEFAKLYQEIQDSLATASMEEQVSSVEALDDMVEAESVAAMMEHEAKDYEDLTADEIAKRRAQTDAELEELNKAANMDYSNIDKKQLEMIEQERLAQIARLNKERAVQDLALSQKELELSQQTRTRNLLFAGAALLMVTSFFMFNRARLRQKSLSKLDAAYAELSNTHSQLKSTQESLIHSQKMASLGQLTSGVAHEIQNPLNFVNNFSALSTDLIDDLDDAETDEEEKKEILEDLKTNIGKIREHGMRADKIVKGMLMFSRSGEAEQQEINVHQMIDQFLELAFSNVQSQHPTFDCKFAKDYHDHVKMISGIHQDLGRVFLNVFNNAFYSMRKKAEKDSNFHPQLNISTNLSLEFEVISISVRDNGEGMSPEILEQIFTPFFTTKPTGEGTGLGLSLSYDIISKGHNGDIKARSESGKYAELEMILPLHG